MLLMSPEEKKLLDAEFHKVFGAYPEGYFSAPGRTEISGNHTDHQRGRVLAAAVNLDTRAAVRRNGTDVIRIRSVGYPMTGINVRELTPVDGEKNTTAALVRGVAAGFARLGCRIAGFDACVSSTVLSGSGLSSSAAFEVLLATIINHLFYDGRATGPEMAKIGQYAENVFFGKPCGLMDQMASAVGGLVSIDFADRENPVVTPVDFDFSKTGYTLCIIDSRADHADLTDEYAAIPGELGTISAYFGKEVLTEVEEQAFYAAIPTLRKQCGDRAVLRAIHIYEENRRVPMQVESLRRGDFEAFLRLENESGLSSWMCLQNVQPTGSVREQALALTLTLCRKALGGRGACRVHGGGFAGTAQAFVPVDMLDSFRTEIERVLGPGSCHALSIRCQGGVPMAEMDCGEKKE